MSTDRKLPDWIDAYIFYTDNTEPRQSFREWAAVSTIAACLRRKVSLPWGRYTYYPNMYIVLVGPPAARKGTAMEPPEMLLDTLGIERSADECSRQKLIARLREAVAVEKTGSRIFSHCSLTVFAPELTVFIGYHQMEMLTILNAWFDCRNRFEYETLSRGKELVANVWVNLFGATTPTLLRASMPEESVGSGFTSRTIFVYEENLDKIVIFPGLSPEQKAIEPLLLEDLERISTLIGEFQFTDAYLATYAKWRETQEANPPFQGTPLQGYTARRPLHFLKLSIILSASRTNDLTLDAQDAERAIKMLARTERKMPKVFSGLGVNPLAEVQVRVMETIGLYGRIKIGDLMNKFLSDLTHAQLSDIIASLEMTGFCAYDRVEREVVYKGGKT